MNLSRRSALFSAGLGLLAPRMVVAQTAAVVTREAVDSRDFQARGLAVKGMVTSIIDLYHAYGIIADGVTDNATALMRMRSDLAGSGKPHYQLHAPSGGTILYSNNRWLYNIQSFDLYGHGTRFSTIYTGGDNKLQSAFYNGDMFQNNTLAYAGTITYPNFYNFNTANIGDYTITCTTTSDSTNFSAGNRVFIWGYAQVGTTGYPPDARYFEWNTVVAVNTSTGVLTLQKSLKHRYDTAWWDIINITDHLQNGIPRITILDPNVQGFPVYAGFHDMTWGADTNGDGGDIIFVAQEVYMSHVKGEPGSFVWPSHNELIRYEDCVFYNNEFDKLVDHVIAERCTFVGEGPVNGTSINTIELIDCDANQTTWLCPRELIIRRGTYKADTQTPSLAVIDSPAAKNPIRRITLDGPIRLAVTTANGGAASSLLNLAQMTSNPITLTSSNISGNDIVISFVSWTDVSNEPAFQMEAGVTRMFKDDGTKGGLVTNIIWDSTVGSSGGYRISGNWNVAPASGDVWRWSPVAEVIDSNDHIIVQSTSSIGLWNGQSARWAGNKTGRRKIHTMELDSSTVNWFRSVGLTIDWYAKIVDVEINVGKPYNGTASSALLVLQDQTYTQVMQVDLTTTGRRYLSEFQALGSVGTDSFSAASIVGSWKKQLHIYAWQTGAVQISDISAPALPELSILIRWKDS